MKWICLHRASFTHALAHNKYYLKLILESKSRLPIPEFSGYYCITSGDKKTIFTNINQKLFNTFIEFVHLIKLNLSFKVIICDAVNRMEWIS